MAMQVMQVMGKKISTIMGRNPRVIQYLAISHGVPTLIKFELALADYDMKIEQFDLFLNRV